LSVAYLKAILTVLDSKATLKPTASHFKAALAISCSNQHSYNSLPWGSNCSKLFESSGL